MRSFRRAVNPQSRVSSIVASLILLFGLLAAPSQVQSQAAEKSPGANQCGVYVEAYNTGSPGYSSYLKFTNDVAKSRDKRESSKRYTNALHESAPAANALWLNNWCTKNPLRNFAEASNRLLDELTGQTGNQTASPGTGQAASQKEKPSISDSLVIMLSGDQPSPNSCKVGNTKYCSGCSIACTEGSKAQCVVGTDSFNGDKCFQQSVCRCK